LSFGFPYRKVNLEPIYDEILMACASKVTIFAAASNEGGNSGVAFPASLNEVICIGSTDGQGNKSKFTPGPYSGKKFATLGEGVRSSWPKHLSGDGLSTQERKSGTSYATPIAAGIAAMVLDYMRQHPNSDKYLVSKLRGKRGTKTALREIVEERDGFQYLRPWKLFTSERKEDIVGVMQSLLRLV
jgi:subtilisin family serine protease